jgi:branched-chain amino acid transport system permease protein
LTMTFIWIIFATSLRLPMTLGLVSFAHAGFLAIGAYTSALLTMKLGFSFWLAMPLSGVSAGIVALIFGLPMLRTKGHYFFLCSVAFGMVIVLMFSTQWRGVFGGTMGISHIPYPSASFASHISYFYYLALGLATLTVAFAFRIDNCRIGMEWRAIREIDDLAALIGIDIVGVKIVAFIIACFFAGISGSLMAHYLRFISPDTFGFPTMLFCLTTVVVGGKDSAWGPAIGVLLLRVIIFLVGGLREWEVIIYSALLVLSVTLLPQGIISLPYWAIKSRVEKKGIEGMVETTNI